MTTRTHDALICSCGHKGMLHTAENDQPFSSEWFSRKVEGFIDHDERFGIKKLTCPVCGKSGEVCLA